MVVLLEYISIIYQLFAHALYEIHWNEKLKLDKSIYCVKTKYYLKPRIRVVIFAKRIIAVTCVLKY